MALLTTTTTLMVLTVVLIWAEVRYLLIQIQTDCAASQPYWRTAWLVGIAGILAIELWPGVSHWASNAVQFAAGLP